jgi:hypothetical protein
MWEYFSGSEGSQNRSSRPKSSSGGVSSRLGKPSIALREGGGLLELPGNTGGLSGITRLGIGDLMPTVIVVPP